MLIRPISHCKGLGGGGVAVHIQSQTYFQLIMVLVGSHGYPDGYITPTVCQHNKILFIPSRSFFSQNPHPFHKFLRD